MKNKIIIILVMISLLSSFAMASTLTRNAPTIVQPGQVFQVTYSTSNVPLAPETWFVAWADNITGGCTPLLYESFMIDSVGGNNKNDTTSFTAPSSGSCIFSGYYQFAGESKIDFPIKTITVNSSAPIPPAQIKINEFVSNGSNDWVEVFNPTSGIVDLTLCDLNDSTSKMEDLTGNLAIGGFAAFDVSNRLNDAGDTIKLICSDSTVDQIIYPSGVSTPITGKSAGRYPNGNGAWLVLDTPTKGAANINNTITPPTPPSNATDDLMINYVRGKILIGGIPQAGVNYTITVTSGANNGQVYPGKVDDSNVYLTGNGYFDTADRTIFSTDASFRIDVQKNCTGSSGTASGVFENGGNGWFSPEANLTIINCTLPVNYNPLFVNGPIIVSPWAEDNQRNIDLALYFTDINDSLTYSVSGNTNINISFAAGIAMMKPAANWSGSETVVFKATDTLGLFNVSNNVSLTITPVNDYPTIEKINTITVSEGQVVEIIANGSTVDSGETLTYSINDTAKFTDNGNGNFTWLTDYSSNGIYFFNVTVDDGVYMASTIAKVNVSNVDRAPLFLFDIGDIIMNEDTTATLNLSTNFSDPDGDLMTYSASGQDANMTISFAGGIATLKPAGNWSGTQTVVFNATSKGLTNSSNSVTITVLPVNDAPNIIVPSEFNVSENNTLTIIATGNDADNATSELEFHINDTTKFVENTILGMGNFSWQTLLGDENTYFFNVSVTDGTSIIGKIVRVNVLHTNRLPEISIENQTIEEDSGIHYANITASDSDGTVTGFSIKNENISEVDCDTLYTDYLLKFKPAANFTGLAYCKVEATDDRNGKSSIIVQINVTNVNDAPMIIDYSPKSNPVIIKEDRSQNFSITVKDIDNSDGDITANWTVNGNFVMLGNPFTFNAADFGNLDSIVVINVSDGIESTIKTWDVRIVDRPFASMPPWNGETTDFAAMNDSEVAGLNNFFPLILEKIPFGRIEFLEPVDLSGDAVDFDNNADIQQALAGINTGYFTTLHNKMARVTFWNINEPTMPIIYYNGAYTLNRNNINLPCPTSICQNSTFDNGTLSFIAPFSSYKVGNAQTCTQLGGDLCTGNEVCEGSILPNAIEGNKCCSVTCNSAFSDVHRCEYINTSIQVSISDPNAGDEFEVGDKIPIEIDIKNNAHEDINFDVYASLYDTTADKEIKKVSDSITIDQGESDSVTLSISVKDFKSNNKHAIFVRVDGDGYCNEKSVKINLNREEHDVVIKRLDIPEARCGESIEAEIEIENQGKSDEDVTLELYNSELGIMHTEEFSIDKAGKDDNIVKSYLITIPDYIETKIYPLTAKVSFEDGENTKTEEFYIDCAKPITTAQETIDVSTLTSQGTGISQSSLLGQLSPDCILIVNILLGMGIILMIILIILAKRL